MAMARRGPLVAITLLALAGCEAGKVTEIIVSVNTDLKVPPANPPKQIRQVLFQVERNLISEPGQEPHGDVVIADPWDLTPMPGEEGHVTLPATVGLLPGDDRDMDEPILITVSTVVYMSATEKEGEKYPLRRQARLPFARDRVLLVRMNLLARCVQLDCPIGYTCGESGCEPIDKDVTKLPSWSWDAAMAPVPDGLPPFPDGLVPADGGVDGGADATPPDGPPPDGPPADGPSDAPPLDAPPDTQTDIPPTDTLPPDTLATDTTSPWDGPVADAPTDTSSADLFPWPDGPLPDAPWPDGPWPDGPWPDQAQPDAPWPDGPWPDQMLADSTPIGDGPLACVPATVSPSCDTSGWCTVTKGCFKMGSPPTENCRDPNDEDLHEVILTHDFVIAEVETSQGDFDTIMGYNPSLGNSYCNKPKWDLCPVNQVTWNEAVKYCNELSAKEGLTQCFTCTGSGSTTSCSPLAQYAGQNIYLCPGYRLPTEAEWEHAARAGWDTALYTGVDLTVTNCDDGADTALDPIAYYAANAGYTYHPSAEKNPNGWGVYDLLGNMEEWVYDTYWTSLGPGQKIDPAVTTGGTGKVRKGGAFDQGPRAQRTGHRAAYTPIMFNDDLGFRCARTL